VGVNGQIVARVFTCRSCIAKESCFVVKKSVSLQLRRQLCIPLVALVTLTVSMSRSYRLLLPIPYEKLPRSGSGFGFE